MPGKICSDDFREMRSACLGESQQEQRQFETGISKFRSIGEGKGRYISQFTANASTGIFVIIDKVAAWVGHKCAHLMLVKSRDNCTCYSVGLLQPLRRSAAQQPSTKAIGIYCR